MRHYKFNTILIIMNKIEFYKNRDLSGRLSAAAEFLRQNWKVLYKNILIIAIPLVIAMGFFQVNYFSEYINSLDSIVQGNFNIFSNFNFVNILITFLLSVVLYLSLYSITAAIMNSYEVDLLNETPMTKIKNFDTQTNDYNSIY